MVRVKERKKEMIEKQIAELTRGKEFQSPTDGIHSLTLPPIGCVTFVSYSTSLL